MYNEISVNPHGPYLHVTAICDYSIFCEATATAYQEFYYHLQRDCFPIFCRVLKCFQFKHDEKKCMFLFFSHLRIEK